MPNRDDIHIAAALTNVSLAFGQGEFIAETLAPIVNVQKKTDKYFILDTLREGLRQQNTERAPGAPANVADFDITNAQYTAKNHSIRGIVTAEDRSNVDPAIAADIEMTEFLTRSIMVDKEIKLAAVLSAGISAGATPGTKWDVATSDPIADIKLGIITVVDAVQIRPNMLTLPLEVFLELKDHPVIIERVKAGGTMGSPAVVNESALATVFGVERVVIASAYKNTAAKSATATVSNIWSDTCYLSVVPASPGLRTLSMAMTFAWNLAGATNGKVVRQWTDDEAWGDWVECNDQYDQKITSATAAYKLSSVLT